MEGVVRNGPKRCMDVHVQFKSFRGMAVAARRMEIGANARNSGMPTGEGRDIRRCRPRMDHIRRAGGRRAGVAAPGRAAAGDGMTVAGGLARAAPGRAPRAATLRPELPLMPAGTV